MDHRTKSLITVSVLVFIMLAIAFFINNMQGQITGAVVQEECACASDADCTDNNQCTQDLCLYKDVCKAALCVHKPIDGCR
jgi:hypothetical protein